MSVKLIAAIGKNNELGKDNALMWNLPGDMKFFRTATGGSCVIMGRKTYESIGRPLPKRRNIIISRNPELAVEGCEVYSSLDRAIEACQNDCYIIGGAAIYKEALPLADELILTEIDACYPEADVYFPEFDKNLYSREVIAENEDGGVKYKHISYKKKVWEEILTVYVEITGYNVVVSPGSLRHKSSVTMISFSAKAKSKYFVGETVGTGVDTQKVIKSNYSLSARYLLEGVDCDEKPCRVFIENNGDSMDNCVPIIITDSEALRDWNTATLRSTVTPGIGCVTVKIYILR